MFKSLKLKVVVSFVLLVIIPITISAIFLLTHVKASHVSHLNIIHTQMIKRVSSEFENYVNYNVTQMQQATELQELPYNDNRLLTERLISQLMFNNNFDEIILLDDEGREKAHVHRYKITSLIEHKNYSKEIEFLFPKLNRSVYYGDVRFIEETGEPIINISFDLSDPKTNKINGVMLVSLRLKPIWNMLANITVQPGQSVYILDSNGRLVAHPNPSLVLKNINYNVTFQKIDKGLQGEDAYIKYQKVNFGNQYFTVVSEHKTENALKLIGRITIIIAVVMLFTLSMCLLLIAFNIRYIVNPINHLSKVASEIEAGDLDKRATVFADDEIGDMAIAFNNMTEKLKNNTVKLEEFNEGLQKKIKTEIEKTRRMEQMLFEQKKFADMGQMINAIAHQWRQPLNNIGLIQQFLCDGFVEGDITAKEYQEYSDTLMNIVQEMSSTIDDFRTFFTTDKVKEGFNIINAIKDLLKLTSAQLSNSNIKFTLECDVCPSKHSFSSDLLNIECSNDKITIYGQAGEFKQVMQNIIMNAKDAFAERNIKSPLISIFVKLSGDEIIITFKDNAGGIDDDVMPSIFDPYFTTKEEGKGTGIGLFISKIIIDEHFGGKLYAKNNDKGVEFIIHLPMSKPELPLDNA